jgi:hypothetical protein
MENKNSEMKNLDIENDEINILRNLEQDRLLKISGLLKEKFNFTLLKKKSNIKNAGDGLFIDGKCEVFIFFLIII